jgi:hypothetical protein
MEANFRCLLPSKPLGGAIGPGHADRAIPQRVEQQRTGQHTRLPGFDHGARLDTRYVSTLDSTLANVERRDRRKRF